MRVFKGTMNKELYSEILDSILLPFILLVYRTHHRFMARQRSKHVSGNTRCWLPEHGIHWWKTPDESPDLNPIEKVWHEVKEDICHEVQPCNKDPLVNGILPFWRTVTVENVGGTLDV